MLISGKGFLLNKHTKKKQRNWPKFNVRINSSHPKKKLPKENSKKYSLNEKPIPSSQILKIASDWRWIGLISLKKIPWKLTYPLKIAGFGRCKFPFKGPFVPLRGGHPFLPGKGKQRERNHRLGPATGKQRGTVSGVGVQEEENPSCCFFFPYGSVRIRCSECTERVQFGGKS